MLGIDRLNSRKASKQTLGFMDETEQRTRTYSQRVCLDAFLLLSLSIPSILILIGNKLIPFNKPYLVGLELHYIEEACRLNKLSGDGAFTKNSGMVRRAHGL